MMLAMEVLYSSSTELSATICSWCENVVSGQVNKDDRKKGSSVYALALSLEAVDSISI